MTLLLFPDGTTWLYDCNVTGENEALVLSYLAKAMGYRRIINAFICSHRDADHMRGIKTIHKRFPLGGIWDNGVEGTTTDSPEYREYMDLRRQLTTGVIKVHTQVVGGVCVAWLHSADRDFSAANDQSVVVKFDHRGSSTLLLGDTSFKPWRDKLVRIHGATLKANVLLAAHHGSLTFFDDPADEQHYFTAHLNTIKPEMTVVSVGPNVHDLPDAKALELYAKYSTGSSSGQKVWSTESQGNVRLELKGGGAWSMTPNQ